MKTAAVRLDASREQLRRGLQAVPEAADPGQALAADWLSAARAWEARRWSMA